MANDSKQMTIVIALMAINTILLVGIFCAVKGFCYKGGGMYCPMKKEVGYMCPFTGKTMMPPKGVTAK